MDVKVEIVSKEFVRPSSPTPSHLRNYKLSMLDQLSPEQYVPIVLFYSPTSETYPEIVQALKKSLSETLTRLYPLAGRMRLGKAAESSVDCNDEGALFVEARVLETDLSTILGTNETIGLLDRFLPFHPYALLMRGLKDNDNNQDDHEQILMTGVQVNEFDCGGIAVGVCVYHKIADASTLSSFLASWAGAEQEGEEKARVSPDSNTAASVLFPPREIPREVSIPRGAILSEGKLAVKRFVFDAASLASLREKIGAIDDGDGHATRVESATALIWKSSLEASKSSGKMETLPTSLAVQIVNLRPRIQPPVPLNAFGNFWANTVAFSADQNNLNNKEVGLGLLAAEIRKSIRKIDPDYVLELQGDNGVAKSFEVIGLTMSMLSKGEVDQVYGFSSWAGFPFYETDFGYGKPVWVCTTGGITKNYVNFLSDRSGDGLEALVTLLEQDMIEFETNPELCQFLSQTSP